MRFNDNKLGLDTVSDSEQGRQVGVQRGGGGGVVVGRCAIERGYMMKEVGRSRVWSVTSKSHHTQFHPILLLPRTGHSTTNTTKITCTASRQISDWLFDRAQATW